MPTKKPKKASKGQHHIRMADDLRKRIQLFIEDTQEQTGIEVGFSEAIRVLIEKGLKVAKAS